MTWTPRFSARFEGPIIDNVLAIIVRDFKSGLDYFYETENLPDFAERSIGTELGLTFPILVIGPRSNRIETVDDASHLVEPIAIELKVGVTGNSAKDAIVKVMKYVRAMDAVLRTATYQDYFAGFETGAAQPFAFSVDVTHEYGPLGANDSKTTYFKPATMELSLNFRER